MKKNYIITYIENGKEETIERMETLETLKERLNFYKQNDITVINLEEKVIITQLINLNELLEKWSER